MKKLLFHAVAPAGLFGLSIVTAFAQPAFSLRAHIPFAFEAGGARLPAGDYTVRQDSLSGLITLQASNGGAAVLTTGSNSGIGRDTQLIFERRNGRVVLTEIRLLDQPGRLLSSEVVRLK